MIEYLDSQLNSPEPEQIAAATTTSPIAVIKKLEPLQTKSMYSNPKKTIAALNERYYSKKSEQYSDITARRDRRHQNC